MVKREQYIEYYVGSYVGGITTYGLYDLWKSWHIKIM